MRSGREAVRLQNHGGARGEQVIHYVQIYQEDIVYAASHPEFQRRLEAARAELLAMKDGGSRR
jgi:hypothetical protein